MTRILDKSWIRSNRYAATKDYDGDDSPDEYPFASTAEGGECATITGVPLGEQRIQGGLLSNFYRENDIGDGDPFRVVVTPATPTLDPEQEQIAPLEAEQMAMMEAMDMGDEE